VLIPEWDERRLQANRRERESHASAVLAFYDSCRLAPGVAVYHVTMQTGKPNAYATDVQRIGGHRAER
jgi:hypothetical protein